MKGKSSLDGFQINHYFKRKALYLGKRIEGWLFLGNNQFDQELQQVMSRLTLFYSIQEESFQYPFRKWKFPSIQLPAFGQKIYPISWNLPKEMMVSGDQIYYELSTEVITVENVRKTKRVRIPILPSPPIVAFFQAWEKLGFRLDATWIEDQVQKFRWVAKNGDPIQACDLSIFLKDNGIRVELRIRLHEKTIPQTWLIPDSRLKDVRHLHAFLEKSLKEVVRNPDPSSEMDEGGIAIGSGVFQAQSLSGDEIVENSSLWEIDDLTLEVFDDDDDED